VLGGERSFAARRVPRVDARIDPRRLVEPAALDQPV
jgi:hypothetical protein